MAEWLAGLGYLGLFIGTFLSGTVLTFSSDILLVGMLTAGGGDPWLSMLCATMGNGLGATTSYLLGWSARWDWLERWFKLKRDKLEAQQRTVDRFGVWLALVSWLPVIGNLLVIALGFYRVKPRLSVVLLFVGCFIRFLFWTLLFIYYGEAFLVERFDTQ